MGFSLARRGDSAYQSGYLRSGAWFRRRRAWFESVEASGRQVVCQVCGTAKRLDLHHLNYEGVTQGPSGAWVAAEAEADLMPLCRGCHEDVHAELDRRRRDFWGWGRSRATAIIVVGLRQRRMGVTRETRARGRRR